METQKIKIESRAHLEAIITCEIHKQGINADLTHLDVSGVADISCLFMESNFNGDISNWDVSSVEDMDAAFMFARKFDGDLSKWNLKKVKDYRFAFDGCPIKKNHKPKFLNTTK